MANVKRKGFVDKNGKQVGLSEETKTFEIILDETRQDDAERFQVSNADAVNFWLNCQKGELYPVLVAFNGNEYREVLATAIVSGEESEIPSIKLHFGLRTMMIDGDGEYTSEYITNGEVDPEDVGWDVSVADNSSIFI